MPLFGVLLILLVLLSPIMRAQENHLQENGTGALLTRSAFAHGYRHGYEQGYHQGNVDANMARPARTKMSQLKGLPLGYDPHFGPRKSFEMGFAAGLQAGYGDGYAGRVFRAMDHLREAGSALTFGPAPDDPSNLYFDKGVAAGYGDGFDRGVPGSSTPREFDLQNVNCAQPSQANPQGSSGEQGYCEGYRRGFLLGQADGVAQPPGGPLLEAGK